MRFVGTGLLSVPHTGEAPGEGAHVREGEECIFVDTRRMGDGKLPELGDGGRLREPRRDEIRHAALFIDLGSTRTLGLVVPDRDAEWDKMECRTLDLMDYAEGVAEVPGPFSSQVVLERCPGDVGKETWPLSEVRTGKAASELYLYGATSMAGAEGRGVQLMASSPKRMIARIDRDRTWRTIGRGDGTALKSYSGPDRAGEAMAEGLVPSRLVGMQVVELVEQAERMLNSQEETHAYRVDEVHVTYPPGWLGPVQENYQEIIQAEVDRWARSRALAVEVEMGCSEALGALVFHWYNRRLVEHRRGGAAGADRPSGREMLAVVDVGGGTSDLLIESITFREVEHIFEFKPVRWQSEETAGDELVRRVAAEVVMPALLRECYQVGEQAAILEYLQDDAHVTEKRLWMRKELRPLAQSCTQAAEHGKIPAAEMSHVRSHLEAIIKKLDEVVGKTGQEGAPADTLMESMPRTARDVVPRLAEEVFKPLADDFAEICKRHGCNEVKLSGKAMDYAAVEGVFRKAFHAQGLMNVGLLVGQHIAGELRGFLGSETVRDSKYATVWGSICKWLLKRNQGHFAEGWDISIMDVVGRPSWYLHGMASRLTRGDCIRLDPLENGRERTIPALPMALSYVQCKDGERVGADEDGAVPVRMYKLGFARADMRLAPGSRPSVELEFTPKGEVRVRHVDHGRVLVGTGESELELGDLTVTLALDYAADSFWLDSGKVELPAGWERGERGGSESADRVPGAKERTSAGRPPLAPRVVKGKPEKPGKGGAVGSGKGARGPSVTDFFAKDYLDNDGNA